jgi:hypothetical protein
MDEDFNYNFIKEQGGGQAHRRPFPKYNSNMRENSQYSADSTQPHGSFSSPGFPSKRRNPTSASSRGGKRPRFTKSSTFSSSRKEPVAYTKSEEPKVTGIQMYAAQRTFTIFVGNKGIDMLSTVMFNAILARDHRMAQNMSRLQLKYVLAMAYANRVTQTSIHGGYALDIPAASDLKRAAGQIQLPGLLVKYIEAIGIYKKATGATVAPYSGGPQQLFPPDNPQQISPQAILAEAGRPIPNNPWCIDYDWIQEWNQATTRPSRIGMSFASVEHVTFEGRAEMLVSFRKIGDEMEPDSPALTYQGVAPQQISEAEGMLGACYGFRDYGNQGVWLPGNKSILFAEFLTTEFQPEQYLSDLIVQSFTT